MRRHNVPHGPGHPLHEAWLGHHAAFGHFGPPGRPPFPPMPPGPWGHRGRGRGGRRGRGDVRAAILALLAERPMHGYEMIQELEARTGGVWRPSPGSVYPTLQLLEDEGLIAGEEGEGRRRFTLTDTGRAEAERQSQKAPWEEVTAGVAPAAWNLRDAIAQTAQAAWSVGSAGSEAQQGRALEVLNDARRRLYAILAEDDQAAADADAADEADDEAEA
jgi:DNA-binding PadR family transcriptional regulator